MEEERVRKEALLTDEEINTSIKDYRHYFYDSQGGRYEGYWTVLKIALQVQVGKTLKTKSIRIECDKQEPPIKGYSADAERMLKAGFVRVLKKE